MIPQYDQKGKMHSKKNQKINLKVVSFVLFFQLIIIVVLSLATYQFYMTSRNPVDKVRDIASLDESYNPQMIYITNIDELKAQNNIQEEVYQDAQDGDLAMIFEENMIIYRESNNEIIYNGKSANTIAEENRENLAQKIINLSKQSNIISSDWDGSPEIKFVTNPERLRNESPSFYAQAQVSDIIAYFDDQDKIVLYRNDTESIVNSGTLSTVIN